MEQLIECLERLIKSSSEDKSEFYFLFSHLKLDKKEEKVFKELFLPRLYYLYDRDLIRKNYVYLALLAGHNYDVLDKVIEHDKSVLVVSLTKPLSLYDYCIYTGQHFLYEIINNSHQFKNKKDVYHKLLMVKTVHLTNLEQINFMQINALLSQINTSFVDDFWKYYIQEVKNLISIVQFCTNLKQQNESAVFNFAAQNSLLTTLSNYLNFRNCEDWDKIFTKLRECADIHELDLFTSFTLLSNFLVVIAPNLQSHIKNQTTDVKGKILGMNDPQMQIEVLENIFSLLFFRNAENHFVFKKEHVKLILNLLKSIADELSLKKSFVKDTDERGRLDSLKNILSDALWRLDLISNIIQGAKFEEQCMRYMLASPESLVHLCLKQEDFHKAYQVVEMFNLRNTDFGREFEYTASLNQLRYFLMKHSTPSFAKSLSTATVDRFFKLKTKEDVRNYQPHEIFTNVFDFAVTTAKCREDWDYLLELGSDQYLEWCDIFPQYVKFYTRIMSIQNEASVLENVSPAVILTTLNHPLDVDTYRTDDAFYRCLKGLYNEFIEHLGLDEPGILNKNHPAHKGLLDINDLCNQYFYESNKNKGNTKYLLKVFNYLQAFSKTLTIQENCTNIVARDRNTSFFALLKFNRSELIGLMLFQKHLDPAAFEQYFERLKLDFLYHIVGNCFPTINLHMEDNVTLDELYHENMLYVPNKSILTYIQKTNWLLAVLVNLMYKIDDKSSTNDVRLNVFLNYMQLPKIDILKPFFDDSKIVTALQNCINSHEVIKYIKRRIIKHELLSVKSDDSLETGEEIEENSIITNWKNLYLFIESIPENQLKAKSELTRLKDQVLVGLVQDGLEEEYHKYVYFIENRDIRVDLITDNFKKWYRKDSLDIIKSEISRFEAVRDTKLEDLILWLPKIEFGDQFKTIVNKTSWYRAYHYARDNKEHALEKIMLSYNVDLFLKFIQLFHPEEQALRIVDTTYIARVLEMETPFILIKTLLDKLPFPHSLNICSSLLSIIRNLECLQFLVDYLNNNKADNVLIKNVEVSLKILSICNDSEKFYYFGLISEPLNILEVMIMNVQLDRLDSVLKLLDLEHNQQDYDDRVISVQKVDALLRQYAEKSLEFRVITRPSSREMRLPENGLLQSVDSASLSGRRRQFVIPEDVPTKEEWIPNDKVLECMCCQQVTFSMFNRRHHCRRCGRVVCYSCSTKRMLVSTYGDLLVRVCDDCYEKASDASSSSSRTSIQQLWMLNNNAEHNRITREEFSYEHAPSVPLCFSIMKYHSQTEEYSTFLLGQCEIMLKLLQPSKELIREIDYSLVIRMLKSLATAAKVHSDENCEDVDRILSQVELLGLLAQRGCLHLMPVLNSRPPYLDTVILRRLRERILQLELWDLALEVSTKTGVDNTGVFAVWGKKCLSAGKFMSARDKLHRCLDRSPDWNPNMNSSSMTLSSSGTASTRTISESYSKESPMLHEVIQILESQTRIIVPEAAQKAQKNKTASSTTTLHQSLIANQADSAIIILNRLNNVKNIKTGNLCLSHKQMPTKYNHNAVLDPIIYDECIYYLKKYGTAKSLAEFYIRHGHMETALRYIIDNKIGTEVFAEVYVKCLKDGIVHILQDCMSIIDPSLESWKDYLVKTCAYLASKNHLHSLHQIQLFMRDHIRAVITCFKFYEEGAGSYTTFVTNVGHLRQAEKHLKQYLENEEKAGQPSKKQAQTMPPSFIKTMTTKDIHQHLNTIEKQVELANYLSKCESRGFNTIEAVKDLRMLIDLWGSASSLKLPTLFDDRIVKCALVALVIVAADSIKTGFQYANILIDEFKLKALRVYQLAGKELTQTKRYNELSELVGCVWSLKLKDSLLLKAMDDVLVAAVQVVLETNPPNVKVHSLIKYIADRGTKVARYIDAQQLKMACFFAVKYRRMDDVQIILEEAKRLNNIDVQRWCEVVLKDPPKPPATSKGQ